MEIYTIRGDKTVEIYDLTNNNVESAFNRFKRFFNSCKNYGIYEYITRGDIDLFKDKDDNDVIFRCEISHEPQFHMSIINDELESGLEIVTTLDRRVIPYGSVIKFIDDDVIIVKKNIISELKNDMIMERLSEENYVYERANKEGVSKYAEICFNTK